MLRLSLVALALCLAAPALAGAQTIDSPYRFIESGQSVELFGGYLATERGQLDLGPHSAPLVGVRYGGRLSGPVIAGGSVSFIPSQRTVYQVEQGTGDLDALGDVDAPLLLGEAGIRFQVTGERTWHRLAPYLGATIGVITNLAGTSSLEAELEAEERVDFGPAFAVGGSVGADWFLTERFSIRGAGVTQLWRFTAPAGLAGGEESEWLNAYGGTLGVAFHF
jgi:hypothetical protein